MSKHVLSVLGAVMLTLAIAAIALAQDDNHNRYQDSAKPRRHLHDN